MKHTSPLLSLVALLLTAAIACAADDGFVDLLAPGDLRHFDTEGNWIVQDDGSVKLEPRPGESGWTRYGSYLWLKDQYADFIYDLEFKYPPKGNSGLYFRVGEKDHATETGIEAQIWDTHGKKNPGPHDCGGIIRAQAPSKNMVKPAGQWNRMIVTCQVDTIKVELNGEQVIDMRISQTPLKDRPTKGWIGLQDHGQPIWFRNLKIKRLK